MHREAGCREPALHRTAPHSIEQTGVSALNDIGFDTSSARAFARQRHEVIVAEVRRRGSVRVSELAVLLGVSDMTVRRDLDLLDDAGLLSKVHGGATLRDEHSTDEPGFEAKSLRNMAEKHAIAMAAAGRRAGRAARSASPPGPPRGNWRTTSSTSPT